MRDFPFNFNDLNNFSKQLPYKLKLNTEENKLFNELKILEKELNFPAIRDDIGQFINFIFHWIKPTTVFEFGSGYGQSCFWYLLGNNSIEKVVLTEKRTDLKHRYEELPWPTKWQSKIKYHQDDAFEVFKSMPDKFDFVLIDGVKADYLAFLKECEAKLSKDGLVLIDNSYWRGSFLDKEMVASKETARKINELHQYIDSSTVWDAVFVPFEDGVTLLRKNIYLKSL